MNRKLPTCASSGQVLISTWNHFFLSFFFLTTLVNLLRRWCRGKPIAGSSANLVAFQSLTLHPQVHHLFSFSLNCFMQPHQHMDTLPTAMKDGKKRDLVKTVRLKDERFYFCRDTISDFPIDFQSRPTTAAAQPASFSCLGSSGLEDAV